MQQDIILFLQNHMLLSTAFATILVVLFVLELIKLKRGTKALSPAQVTHFINKENAAVVDIRSRDAFLSGHIVGATSIPLREIEEKRKKLDQFKTRPIILACAAGLESQRAANLLTKQGYSVYLLSGGIRAWREAAMPIVKE